MGAARPGDRAAGAGHGRADSPRTAIGSSGATSSSRSSPSGSRRRPARPGSSGSTTPASRPARSSTSPRRSPRRRPSAAREPRAARAPDPRARRPGRHPVRAGGNARLGPPPAADSSASTPTRSSREAGYDRADADRRVCRAAGSAGPPEDLDVHPAEPPPGDDQRDADDRQRHRDRRAAARGPGCTSSSATDRATSASPTGQQPGERGHARGERHRGHEPQPDDRRRRAATRRRPSRTA